MSILFDVDLKPDIPHLPFYSLSYKKPGLPDYTEDFFKIVTRPITVIEFFAFILAGSMGYGKTEWVKWAAAKIIEHYGAENVNAIRNRKGDLNSLLEAMDDRPVQVLFCDDSFGDLPGDLYHQFSLIRHRYEDILKEAGKPLKGVIYAFFGVQDFYQLDKRVRRVATGIIHKAGTVDRWGERDLKAALGDEGIKELNLIDQKAVSYTHLTLPTN